MRRGASSSMFRRFAIADEAMMRGAMPRVSAADLSPLDDRRVRTVLASSGLSRLVRVVPVLTASLAERAAVRRG